MWNWKAIYEDDQYAFFGDLDNVVDTVGDEEGIYASTECYQSLPPRFGVWTSLFLKKKTALTKYVTARKRGGLSISGYDSYRYSLCLVEIDSGTMKYRLIPATDCNDKDQQIGGSTILDNIDPPLVDGVATEWSAIGSRKTHSMIKALCKIFTL